MQFAANLIDERINSGKELSAVCGGKAFWPILSQPLPVMGVDHDCLLQSGMKRCTDFCRIGKTA